MEIDITDLVQNPDFSPWDLCNSVANLGEDAGRMTWDNSKELAAELTLQRDRCLLDTKEKRIAFREWANGYSDFFEDAENDTRINETNALFLQWVAGDIREAFGDWPFDDWNWDDYEKECEAGHCSSNIFRSKDRVYFSFD